jgi:hypothetical protein
MQQTRSTRFRQSESARRGSSVLDYMLILAAMLPIVLFVIIKGKRVMQLVWEMFCVLVSWPMM